jgi:hypothetical protein
MEQWQAGGEEVKPRLSLEDLRALQFYKSLPWGTKVFLGDQPAKTSGMYGSGIVCLKIKGRNTDIRVGDPILRTLRV